MDSAEMETADAFPLDPMIAAAGQSSIHCDPNSSTCGQAALPLVEPPAFAPPTHEVS